MKHIQIFVTYCIILIIGLLLWTSMDILTEKNKEIKIAMAQILCIDGDRSGNFVRIENALKEAHSKEAQIVLFPESSIFGWLNPVAHQRATPIPGKDSDLLCGLAKKYGVFICIGLDEKEGENLYGSAILIDDEGKIVLKHRKINVLPDLMSPPYSVGKGVQVVKTKYGKIGVIICADSFQKDLLTEMKEMRPNLLLIPYGWAAKEEEWPQHAQELTKVVQNAAKTVGCPVIGTDLVGQISHGPWTGQTYGGASIASNKEGAILAQGKDRDQDIVVISLSLK